MLDSSVVRFTPSFRVAPDGLGDPGAALLICRAESPAEMLWGEWLRMRRYAVVCVM